MDGTLCGDAHSVPGLLSDGRRVSVQVTRFTVIGMAKVAPEPETRGSKDYRRVNTCKPVEDDLEVRTHIQDLLVTKPPVQLEDRSTAFDLLSFKKDSKGTDKPPSNARTVNESEAMEALASDDDKYLPGVLHLNAKLPVGVIHPESLCLFIWNLVVCLSLLYMATVMPVVLSFYEEEQIQYTYIDAGLDWVFMCDLMLNFIVSYYEKEELVTSRCKIFTHYLKTWFVLDLAASVPLSFISLVNTDDSSREVSLLKLAKLPRLYRLIKFARLFKIISKLKSRKWINALAEKANLSLASLRSLKFLIILMFLLHLTACAWYYVESIESFSPDTWISRQNLMDKSIGDYYLWCLYWALTVLDTIGYGDIVPRTSFEIIVCLIWMAVGISFYSYTISNLSVMFYNINKRENFIQQKEDFLKEFAKNVSMPKALLKQVKYYVRYNYNHNVFSWSEMHQFLKELPSKLYSQVYRHIFKDVLENIAFFKTKPPEFISDIMPLMKTVVVHEGYELYSYGSTPKDVFFLLKGRVMVKDKMNAVLFSYVKGSYFGEMEVLKKTDRKTSTQIEETAHLLKIESDDFLSVLDKYPDVKQEVWSIAENRLLALQEKKNKFKEARRKLNKLQQRSRDKDLTKLNPLLNNILSMNVDDEESAQMPKSEEPEDASDPLPEHNRFLNAFKRRGNAKPTAKKMTHVGTRTFNETQIEFLLDEINAKHKSIEAFSVRIADICREQEEMYEKLSELYEKLDPGRSSP